MVHFYPGPKTVMLFGESTVGKYAHLNPNYTNQIYTGSSKKKKPAKATNSAMELYIYVV